MALNIILTRNNTGPTDLDVYDRNEFQNQEKPCRISKQTNRSAQRTNYNAATVNVWTRNCFVTIDRTARTSPTKTRAVSGGPVNWNHATAVCRRSRDRLLISNGLLFLVIYTGVETDPNRAPDCDPNQCVLPDCFCSADGTRIPGGLEPSQVNAVYKIPKDLGGIFYFFSPIHLQPVSFAF